MIQNNIKLTKKEEEVLHWVINGLRNKQIGQRMKLTDSTIKVHVSKIMKKYGVRTRTALAISASQNQLTTYTPAVLEEIPYAWVKHTKTFAGIDFNARPDDSWVPVYKRK